MTVVESTGRDRVAGIDGGEGDRASRDDSGDGGDGDRGGGDDRGDFDERGDFSLAAGAPASMAALTAADAAADDIFSRFAIDDVEVCFDSW